MPLTFDRRRLTLGLVATVLAITAIGAGLQAADHRDSTLLTNNPAVDIADVYSFRSPTNPANVVLVMTVSGFIPPTETGMHAFEPDALYQFKIDNNGDATEDLVIQALAVGDGSSQTIEILGPAVPTATGAETKLVSNRSTVTVPVSLTGQARVVSRGGVTAFAGLRDDPFFFDLTQFQRIVGGMAGSFNNPGVDAFAGFNLLAIAVELPASMLGNRPDIKVWATASRPRSN